MANSKCLMRKTVMISITPNDQCFKLNTAKTIYYNIIGLNQAILHETWAFVG